MEIKIYEDKYKNQIIALILYIQNFDSKVNLSLEEQPDMNDINNYYLKNGGGFWIAVNESDDVIGTLGLLKKENGYGVLKKFFVHENYRGKEYMTAVKLHEELEKHAKKCGIKTILLDTPSACTRAHRFYKKMGYKMITKEALPLHYDYTDRNSYIFIKTLQDDETKI